MPKTKNLQIIDNDGNAIDIEEIRSALQAKHFTDETKQSIVDEYGEGITYILDEGADNSDSHEPMPEQSPRRH